MACPNSVVDCAVLNIVGAMRARDAMRKVRRGLDLGRGLVTLGTPVFRAPRSKIRVREGASAKWGTRCELGRGIRVGVHGEGATLTVGPRVRIGPFSQINCVDSVSIGSGTEISWDVQILDTDFHQITSLDGRESKRSAPVTIGERVLIGSRATILKGVSIGDGAVIGSGSVVTRDVPPGTLVAGNPARAIRQVAGWR